MGLDIRLASHRLIQLLSFAVGLPMGSSTASVIAFPFAETRG